MEIAKKKNHFVDESLIINTQYYNDNELKKIPFMSK